MDIGVRMSPGVLEGKLDQATSPKPEAAWNLARWPQGLEPKGANRLFVASGHQWVGYFVLSPDALYLPEDKKTPYVLLFNTRSWTPITPQPAPRFRGFTYIVPKLPLRPADVARARRYPRNPTSPATTPSTTKPRDPPADSLNRDPR